MNNTGAIGRYVSIWRAAKQMEVEHAGTPVASGRALEFLPAVLEIQDAPPSPIGRAISWTIMGVVTAAFVWSCVGWVDIVAVAQGKIIPSGYSKAIQPLESGVVAAIHVQDGQVVKKGQVLIELDPTVNRADGERATNEYQAALVDAARLRAVIAGDLTFAPPPKSDLHYVGIQQQLLRDQLAEYQARVEAAEHLIEQRKAAVGATKENIQRLEATVPMETDARRRIKSFSRMMPSQSWIFLQAEEQRIDKTQELAGPT